MVNYVKETTTSAVKGHSLFFSEGRGKPQTKRQAAPGPTTPSYTGTSKVK